MSLLLGFRRGQTREPESATSGGGSSNQSHSGGGGFFPSLFSGSGFWGSSIATPSSLPPKPSPLSSSGSVPPPQPVPSTSENAAEMQTNPTNPMPFFSPSPSPISSDFPPHPEANINQPNPNPRNPNPPDPNSVNPNPVNHNPNPNPNPERSTLSFSGIQRSFSGPCDPERAATMDPTAFSLPSTAANLHMPKTDCGPDSHRRSERVAPLEDGFSAGPSWNSFGESQEVFIFGSSSGIKTDSRRETSSSSSSAFAVSSPRSRTGKPKRFGSTNPGNPFGKGKVSENAESFRAGKTPGGSQAPIKDVPYDVEHQFEYWSPFPKFEDDYNVMAEDKTGPESQNPLPESTKEEEEDAKEEDYDNTNIYLQNPTVANTPHILEEPIENISADMATKCHVREHTLDSDRTASQMPPDADAEWPQGTCEDLSKQFSEGCSLTTDEQEKVHLKTNSRNSQGEPFVFGTAFNMNPQAPSSSSRNSFSVAPERQEANATTTSGFPNHAFPFDTRVSLSSSDDIQRFPHNKDMLFGGGSSSNEIGSDPSVDQFQFSDKRSVGTGSISNSESLSPENSPTRSEGKQASSYFGPTLGPNRSFEFRSIFNEASNISGAKWLKEKPRKPPAAARKPIRRNARKSKRNAAILGKLPTENREEGGGGSPMDISSQFEVEPSWRGQSVDSEEDEWEVTLDVDPVVEDLTVMANDLQIGNRQSTEAVKEVIWPGFKTPRFGTNIEKGNENKVESFYGSVAPQTSVDDPNNKIDSVLALHLKEKVWLGETSDCTEKGTSSKYTSSKVDEASVKGKNLIRKSADANLLPVSRPGQQVESSVVAASNAARSAAAEQACERLRVRGNMAYANGDFLKADEYYTRGANCVTSNETSESCIKASMLCYSNRAATRMAMGRMREALADCIHAMSKDTKFLRVQLRAASCHLALGESKDAASLFKECLKKHPKEADFPEQKVIAEATEGLKKAQQLDECIYRVSELLGDSASADPPTALRLLNEALLISPYSDKLLEIKARALLSLRRYDEVIQLCEQTLASARQNHNDSLVVSTSNGASNHFQLWRWMLSAKALFYLGKLEEALDLLMKYEPARSTMAMEKSMNVIDESLQSFMSKVQDLLDHKNAGNEAFQMGKHAEAVQHYTAVVASNIESWPFAAVCFANRAAASKSLGQVTDAIADCSRAIALDPTYAKVLSRRSALLEMVRDYDNACHDLRRFISLLESDQGQGKIEQVGKGVTTSTVSQDLREARERLAKNEEAAKKNHPLDHFLILGVESSSSANEIKKAYRKAALKHHPDKAGQFLASGEPGHEDIIWKEAANEIRKDTERLFKMIGEAYAILSDPPKRVKYEAEEELRKLRTRDMTTMQANSEQQYGSHFGNRRQRDRWDPWTRFS